MAEESTGPLSRLREAADKNEGTAKLADALQEYLTAKATSMAGDLAKKIGGYTEQLASGGASGSMGAVAEGGKKLLEGKGPASAVSGAAGKGVKDTAKGLMGKVTGGGGDGGGSGSGGGGGGGGSGPKAINIVENIDVGVPLRAAYNQWTRFPDFGTFAKGVLSVEEEDEITSKWTAKIFWSTRSWKATITEQIQDHRISWTSEGDKGTTKGVVTFHPLGESLTRVLLVVEYFPKGFFEQTANLWRAQGRRLRLDLKHYRRQIMMMAQPEAEELEGWRGEIRDSEVVLSNDDALELEEADLTDEQWAELDELEEEERAELAELDEDERAELAELAESGAEDTEAEDEYAEEEEPEEEDEYAEDEEEGEYAEEEEPEEEGEYAEEEEEEQERPSTGR
ncbi:SRPBCC family protein [Streptomonospora algeriensis]|uniref:SRPBCC family protein n=1 Tax=Streptomonospora algeriensis TaxID=995084 RepID=A0ABW3BIQ6_9ACTN